MNLMAENAESATSVVVRGDDQNLRTNFARQTSFHVMRFLAGRESLNRTDSNRRTLRNMLNVFFGQLDLGELVDLGLCWNVDYHAPSIALIQKLQRTSGTTIGFTCKYQNHVRWLRRIYHQQPARIHCESDKYRGQYDHKDPDTSCSAHLSRQRVIPVCFRIAFSQNTPAAKATQFRMVKSNVFMRHILDLSRKN
jgi:hypothetical protein